MNTVITFLIVCGLVFRVRGQLYTDDVSDGPCTNVPIAANFSSCFLGIFTPKVYGVLMASNALYRNFAESFLGRPALNQAELDAMCFTFAFADTLVIQSGYTNKCNIRTVIPTQLNPQFPSNPLGLGTFALNVTLAQSPGSTTANQYSTVETVAWCDSSNILIVRCVNGTRQDWKVASVGDPADWVFPLTLQKIQALGMPPQNGVLYKSVTQGGNCPVVPNIVAYTLKTLSNIDLSPLELIGTPLESLLDII